MKKIPAFFYLASCLLMPICLQAATPTLVLPKAHIHKIGQQIWTNECAKSIEQLTWWKEGEEFASLGIGHFIWFPNNYHGPFTQTFPSLIAFLKARGVKLPPWLTSTTPCPWQSHKDFFDNFSSSQMLELRNLLASTIDLQIIFISQRLRTALPALFKRLPPKDRVHAKVQFNRLATTPMGIYALIDYVHFKGEGINTKEQYNGRGWGLLQVLARMHGKDGGQKALNDFAQAAKTILAERVHNAPPERNEKRWLPGWHNRIDTYTKEL